jgi:hypothetical protein
MVLLCEFLVLLFRGPPADSEEGGLKGTPDRRIDESHPALRIPSDSSARSATFRMLTLLFADPVASG